MGILSLPIRYTPFLLDSIILHIFPISSGTHIPSLLGSELFIKHPFPIAPHTSSGRNILRASTPFRRSPLNILFRRLDIASLAMHTVLRVDLELYP